MQAARVIKTIFFILVPIQVSLPSHSASERVTKSKGRPGGAGSVIPRIDTGIPPTLKSADVQESHSQCNAVQKIALAQQLTP